MSTKFTKVFVGLMAAVVLMTGVSLAQAASLTQTQIDAIVSLLQSFGADSATVANVQSALTGGAVTPTTTTGIVLSKSLKMGDNNADVKNLQIILNKDAATQVASTGAGSPGNESTYFGSLTKAAVIKFQEKYASEVLTPVGLTAGTGYVGAMTIAKLNTVAGGITTTTTTTGGTTPTVPAGTGLTLSSATQPAATLAPQSAARIPFTKVTLTAGTDGDVVVNGIKIERTGLAQDAVFSGIVLLDENGLQLGLAKTFNSLHQATVGEAFTVKAGQSRTMTIAGNMATDNIAKAGQVAYLSVVGADTTATITGVLPITGAGHTINASLTIGTATVEKGALDPTSSVTKAVGTTGYTFSAVKITAGSAEKARIKSIRWNQSGSVSSSDLANIKTYVDSVAYDVTVSSDGKYYTSTFGDGIVVDKGLTKEISVKGDILSGSSRTADFDIYKTTDLYISGETYGYGITPSATTGTSCSGTTSCDDSEFQTIDPWYDASQVTVGQGSLMVSSSTAVPAGKITNGGAGRSLASFVFDVTGESVTFTQIVLTVATNTGEGGGELLSNVSIYDSNGAAIAGPQDPNSAGTSITYTETVTLPVGKNILTVKGNLNTGWETNATIRISFNPSSALSSVKGVTTDQTITPTPGTIVYGNTQTVSAGALTVSPASSLTTSNVVNGKTGATLGRFVLDATASGEDVKVTSVQVRAITGTNADLDELSSIQLFDGAIALNTGSNVYNPSSNVGAADATLTIALDSGGYIVPKGTTKIIDLKANVNASTTPTSNTTYKFDFSVGSPDWAVTGVTTSQTIAESLQTGAGALMTIASYGTLAITLDSSSPSEKWYSAGTDGVTLGVYRLTGTNEAMTLTDFAVKLPNTASSSPADIEKIYLYDGVTKIAEKSSPAFGGDYSTTNTESFSLPSTGAGSITIPVNGYKTLTVKAKLGSIGTGYPATAGHLIAVATTTTTTNYKATGAESGQTISPTASNAGASAGARVFRSSPTVTRLALTNTTLTNGTNVLYKFSVAADSAYDIGLYKVTFTVSTTTATATAFKLVETTSGKTVKSSATANSNGIVDIVVASADYGADEITISASQTYTYELQATVTGAAIGSSILTQLEGDAGYLTGINAFMDDAPTIHSDQTDNDFIWSDLSVSSHSTTSADWANGYKVSGLPTTNLDASVLSK